MTAAGPCDVWDWSNVAQAESNFALQQPFEQQGVSFWWLDWCCDNSTVSMAGLTPDDWIDHLYAQEMVNKDERGFVLARIGTSYQNPDVVYPAEAWSAHTSAVHFTGDTWGTWNTLAFQAQLSADEATIGEPYVSDDIGSFLGPPPGAPAGHFRLVRPVDPARDVPARPQDALQQRQPAPLGLPTAGRHDRR